MTPSTCQRLVDAADAVLWEFDSRTSITAIHRTTAFAGAFAGVTDVPESAWFELTHPDDMPGLSRLWQAMLSGERSEYRCDWRLRGGDGEWHWVRSVARTTECDAAGLALRIAGLYFNIGPLKVAEAARDASERELIAVIEGSPHPLMIVDEHRRVARWNRSADIMSRKFAGHPIQAGDDAPDLSAVGDHDRVGDYVERALAGESITLERELTVDGTAAWFEFSARPLPLTVDGRRRVVLTAIDITERRQIELARARTMKLESLGMLAGGVAHDFNNLLTAVIGNIELAMTSPGIDAFTRESLDDAVVAARRAAEVAGYLLEYAGRRPARATTLNLGDVAHETVRLLGKSLPPAITLLECSPGEALCAVADRTQLQQMLVNLIVNARDAICERGGGQIIVETRAVAMTPSLRERALVASASAADSFVSVVVEDDGPGMDRATLGRIFEPFFTTKAGGHGLGLASVLGAVRANNATLLLDSQPGRGTRFEVLFPAAPAA